MDSESGTTGGGPGRPPCWRTLKESCKGLGSVSLKINNQHTHTHCVDFMRKWREAQKIKDSLPLMKRALKVPWGHLSEEQRRRASLGFAAPTFGTLAEEEEEETDQEGVDENVFHRRWVGHDRQYGAYQCVCFFVLCNRHRFNKAPGPDPRGPCVVYCTDDR